MVVGEKQIQDMRALQKHKKEGYISIAIDGPAGAGKSSIAKILAKKYGYLYFNTGEIYRSIAYACVKFDTPLEDITKVNIVAHFAPIEYKVVTDKEGKRLAIYYNQEDITKELHSDFISGIVPTIAKYPEIRQQVRGIQQNMAKHNDIVMEGRDIGTIVLPNATHKFFVTASPDARAMRRFKELREQGEHCNYADVLAGIIMRDEQDRHREASPLKKAEDAVMIDTSNMSLYDSVQYIHQVIYQSNKEQVRE